MKALFINTSHRVENIKDLLINAPDASVSEEVLRNYELWMVSSRGGTFL
jgi:hypothetical protein